MEGDYSQGGLVDQSRIKKLKARYDKLKLKFENAVCNKESEKYLKALNIIKEELWTKYNVKI